MTTLTSNTVTFTVSAASVAPTWWTNLSPGSWTTVAGSTGQRITDVVPVPKPADGAKADSNGYGAICDAWAGGCVNQSGRELIFAANGGHNDYAGNEVYAIDFGAETPAWELIGNPSANSAITGTWNTGQIDYNDGAMKSDHTNGNACYYNGKVWFPAQTSFWSGDGASGSGIFSWDRSLGSVAADAWSYYGLNAASGNSNNFAFMPASIDPSTGKIWKVSKYHVANYYSVDAANSGASTLYSGPSGGNGFYADAGGSTIADDLRTWFLTESVVTTSRRLIFMNLDTRTWSSIVTTTSTPTWSNGSGFPAHGAVHYHDGALYWGKPSQFGGQVYKLVIPMSGSAPNAAGTWNWTALANNGTPPSAIGGNGSGTKFNIIHDMGDGAAALVVCDAITAATYVYKIP